MDLFAFVGWNILLGGVLCQVGALALEGGGTWIFDRNGVIPICGTFSSAAGFARYDSFLPASVRSARTS